MEEILTSGIQLLPEKALYLQDERVLIVADLHFGKINHFRRAGLPVPQAANHKNTEALIDLIIKTKPARTIFLGDLFHSHYNGEWEVVGQVVGNFPACKFELVRGNHDIMSEQQYQRKGIRVIDHEAIGSWILTHEPMNSAEIPRDRVNMAGHLHPGARLQGKGRQVVTLPCFWFSKNQIILPAFGSFTGLAPIRPDKNDSVHVILDNKIMKIAVESGSRRSKAA
jgi:DNA ligase-associated metallophosphoesterase